MTKTTATTTYRDLAFERFWDTLAQAAGGILPWDGTTMQALESLMDKIDTARWTTNRCRAATFLNR
jgi:hypothetical protein